MKAENLPFADGEFDVATAIEVLEHVPDPAHTVAEMARVARSATCSSRCRASRCGAGSTWRAAPTSRTSATRPGTSTTGPSARSCALLARHGEVVEARSPFPWTMLLVRL